MKRFFNEKEVTSTLVMDALFSGCKQLEELGRRFDAKKVLSGALSTVSKQVNPRPLCMRCFSASG